MKQTRVMIVEDNTTVAKDLEWCLTDLGYEVTSIQVSGEEAIARTESEKPDITIMDINLRDSMTGIVAAQLINDQFGIPIVFLSAFSDRDLLDKAKLTGAFGYLVKPFQERELLATIEMALYKSKSEKKQRELEAQLAHMEKLEGLRLMAASVAHNFNNILQVPIGYHDLIIQTLPPDSPSLDFINGSHDAVKKAIEISTKMLLYVGAHQSELKKTDINSQVQKAIEEFQGQFPEEHLMSTNLTTAPAFISGDTILLQTLLGDILTNASEAMGDTDGEIAISTRSLSKQDPFLGKTFPDFEFIQNNYIVFQVLDTGCGMDENTKDKIFDPFFSTKFLGRGLGLPTAQGIAGIHKGAITVESQPHEGTVVSVVFPALLARRKAHRD